MLVLIFYPFLILDSVSFVSERNTNGHLSKNTYFNDSKEIKIDFPMTRTRLFKGKRVKKEGEMTGNELRLDE